MSQNVEADDSDSGSLPDLSEIIRVVVPSSDISKGDIVWAKNKNLYWPALVRCVHTKEKKISIWYTHQPGTTFKLPLRNVCLFHDVKMRIKIEKDVREAGCAEEHEGLTSHAKRYLKRKAQGRVDDPMKFFDQTYPFYLVEELLQKNPDADVSSIKIPPLYICHENKRISKSVNFQNCSTSAVESEIESVGSDGESDAESKPKDYLLKVKQEYISVTSKDENIDKIVEFIMSGKADNYLKKILSGRIPSEHRNIYEKAIKCNRKVETPVTYTGPIDNDEKLRELIFYLLPFYDDMTTTQKNKRFSRQRKSKLLVYPSFVKKSNSAQYVASVLLPEAIIYAMSDIYKVSVSAAKQLFQEISECETKKVEKIIASVGSNNTTYNSETDEQKFLEENTQLEQHGSNKEICSPLKKHCVVRLSRNAALEKIICDSTSIGTLNLSKNCLETK